MPDGAVYVGRPGRWGNPFRVGQPYQFFAGGHLVMGDVRDRAQAVDLFRAWLSDRPDGMPDVRTELAGRDLACWCPLDQPCHADVLLQIANEQAEVRRFSTGSPVVDES